MTSAPVGSVMERAGGTATRWRPGVVVGYLALAAIVGWWTWRALHDPASYDTGYAYHAGQIAWATGHPERVGSWDGTPFLAAVMALLSRVLSIRATADLVASISTIVSVGAAVIVLRRTRTLLSPTWWWISAFALLSFGPLMSTVWVKQFNAIVLVLAAAGFDLVRRNQVRRGAVAIGASVALKPMVILLPLVMLARRDTRRAGALSIVWIAGLNLLALVLFALRAHALAPLNPVTSLSDFLGKSKPSFLTCVPWNYSPAALMCRLAAYWPTAIQTLSPHPTLANVYQHLAVQRIVVFAAVIMLGVWVAEALRGCKAVSWEVFAFTSVLSIMLSPLAWTHYQIMLAPLLLLLVVRFTREEAGIGAWAGLLVSFVLSSLAWAPYGTLSGAIRGLAAGGTTTQEPALVDAVAQFAQYILVLTGALWYARRRVGTESVRDV